MRERLTTRDEYGNADIISVDGQALQMNLDFDEFNLVTEALNRLAHFEDLQEQGRLVELPCMAGQEIFIMKISENTNIEKSVALYPCLVTRNENEIQVMDLRNVFLTKAEAQAALERYRFKVRTPLDTEVNMKHILQKDR